MASLNELEQIASEVIGILKRIPACADARIAVIGGLALWKYIPDGRTTDDVDFIVNIDSAPKGVKSQLLALKNTPFVEVAQFFYYKTKDGSHVQIDICPEWQSPYMPAAAVKLKDIKAGNVPYISKIDLIVFKVSSCGLRAQVAKKRTDATDAQNLLELVTAKGPCKLSNAQKEAVLAGLADVVAHSRKSESWWKTRLSLT